VASNNSDYKWRKEKKRKKTIKERVEANSL